MRARQIDPGFGIRDSGFGARDSDRSFRLAIRTVASGFSRKDSAKTRAIGVQKLDLQDQQLTLKVSVPIFGGDQAPRETGLERGAKHTIEIRGSDLYSAFGEQGAGFAAPPDGGSAAWSRRTTCRKQMAYKSRIRLEVVPGWNNAGRKQVRRGPPKRRIITLTSSLPVGTLRDTCLFLYSHAPVRR